MKYKYDIKPQLRGKFDGSIIKAPALADLIKREVNLGKWNVYVGGVEGKSSAKLSYKGKNWEYGEHMFIYGSEREIKHFEQLISKFIKVIPREFANN